MRRPFWTSLTTLVSLALFACAPSHPNYDHTLEADPPPATERAEARFDRALVVSVDGLSAPLLKKMLDAGELPAFRRLVDEGASTFQARTDGIWTKTMPNHAAMLTGRAVEPGPVAHHGWTRNSAPAEGATIHREGYLKSVFDVAFGAGLRTGLYATKAKFRLFLDSWRPVLCEARIRHKDTEALLDRDDGALIDALRERRLDLVFLHLHEPDSAGHKAGWGGSTWKNAVRKADGRLGRILDALSEQTDTVVILTADHGGHGHNHGSRHSLHPHDYTVPFLVWGRGVPAGADLYDLVKRARPAEGRVLFDQDAQPIRNGDAGNLALELLGLDPIPGSALHGLGLGEAIN